MADQQTERARPKGQIRKQNEMLILHAAEDVFSEEGFRGASIGMIAERAGIPKPNVYYYFRSKAELYRRVMEDVCAAWLESGGNFAPQDDPRTAISDYVGAKMDLARSRPKGSRIWATEMARGAPFIASYLETIVRPWMAAREAVLKDWIASGKIAPVDPRAFIYMIWATTQHYADFAAQIRVINGGMALDDSAFAAKRAAVIQMVLATAGLD